MELDGGSKVCSVHERLQFNLRRTIHENSVRLEPKNCYKLIFQLGDICVHEGMLLAKLKTQSRIFLGNAEWQYFYCWKLA